MIPSLHMNKQNAAYVTESQSFPESDRAWAATKSRLSTCALIVILPEKLGLEIKQTEMSYKAL